MILLENVVKILNKTDVKTKIEKICIDDALNRILALDVVSDINMPPFNKSAMDGYAVISEDLSQKFKIMETIAAGSVPENKVNIGECAKVMTGGMVPENANRVVKREITIEENGYMRIKEEDKNRNICIMGEDIKKGDKVLAKGIKIRPQEVGVIASMGLDKIDVYKKPKVGIVSTGSEIITPGQRIKKGQIFDSNSYSLAAQVFASGAELFKRKTTVDEPEKIRESINELLKKCDLVLVSGGVSVGDFDYVPNILEKLGVYLHFTKVAIKPGKPTVFGTKKDKIVFGVPGNPVSTFVVFEIFIKPLIKRMMGHKYNPRLLSGVLEKKIERKKDKRTSFIPVRYKNGNIKQLPYHGSAHIHMLTQANGLLSIPRGIKEIPAGRRMNVRPI